MEVCLGCRLLRWFQSDRKLICASLSRGRPDSELPGISYADCHDGLPAGETEVFETMSVPAGCSNETYGLERKVRQL